MSKAFVRFSWITLVLIFLVILAGSIVRTTGSGMGCPDWPKCFGQIIPPTDVSELPADYKDDYVEGRQKKVFRFANFLEKIGFSETAHQLKTDETLWIEEDFNVARTWTEYGNRLVGFLSGNAVLILLIWVIIRYRHKRKLLILAAVNLILMGFEAWLGSLVVATNLVPWTITLHMLIALIIVGIQIKIIRLAQNKVYDISFSSLFKGLYYFSLVLTFIQVLLGAQVRQEVDFLVKDGLDRAYWLESIGMDFLLHRSFSWLLLAVNLVLFYLNKKFHYGMVAIQYIFGLIVVLFITGVLFSYAGMPAIIQPIHLLVAALLLCVQFYHLEYFKRKRTSMIR